MAEHADNDPVIFEFSASSNISFRGKRETGITWGEWREMVETDRQEAYVEFIYDNLGVDISVVGDES